ncbi:hypothetical protein HBI55_207170 [Parastagonospora nodorum]|nr:hypothetical protein HBH46_197490 [Parastagonospora nodorum]KAH4843547.1 hypothetical protein HBH75_201110 [Parastagonospora nodorum]KAH4919076.1 hypothetical protein HBI79_203520 [Parastagonospora nodorum]KAH5065022.1 hypothetical protein HBH95_211010 [Parastagonospora nodorum]KAH5175457.1 hypothetical protein HBH76_221550 [Parastagonospora nodorum]
MDTCKKEITFCAQGCGANVHYDCMKRWKEQKLANAEIVKCPLFRRIWPTEGGEQALQCADLDADAFRIYYDWLYHRTISLQEDEAPVDLTHRRTHGGKEFCGLLNAYLLGAQVQDKAFRTAILRAFLEVMKETNIYPGPYQINPVYRKTKPSSGIRKFLVEVHVSFAECGWIQEDRKRYPAVFLADLSIALLRTRNVAENTGPQIAKLKDRFCNHGDDIVEELRSDASDSDSD